MLKRNIRTILITSIILFTLFGTVFARISERELKSYSSFFLSKLIKDNQGHESRIRECLNGLVKNGSAGMRLVDKFGLFIYDSRKKGICLNKSRFFYNNGRFYLFIVFEDDYDGQLYTLYLEYEYIRSKRLCLLKDIYFSLVFDEKMKKIEEFFKVR